MPSKPIIEHGGDEMNPITTGKRLRFLKEKILSFQMSTMQLYFMNSPIAQVTNQGINRDTVMKPAVYGSRDYGTEELIAEISTCFFMWRSRNSQQSYQQ